MRILMARGGRGSSVGADEGTASDTETHTHSDTHSDHSVEWTRTADKAHAQQSTNAVVGQCVGPVMCGWVYVSVYVYLCVCVCARVCV